MTTRSGQRFKATMQEEDQPAAGRFAAEQPAGMTEMLQMLIEDRRRRDEEVQLLRQMVEQSMSRRERPDIAPTDKNVKLTKLGENDDIESFLTTFERMMIAYETPKERWAFKLAPQLTGKAQQAFAAMELGLSAQYDEVKAAILRRYGINEEAYRQRFRTASRKDDETNRELAVRLGDTARKWSKRCSTTEELMELIVVEQLLETLPSHVRIWVRERKPTTGVEAGQLADDYFEARRGTNRGSERPTNRPAAPTNRQPSEKPTEPRKCFTCGSTAHLRNDCPKRSESTRPEGKLATLKCFNCGNRGHISERCPAKPTLYCSLGERNGQLSRTGKVAGTTVDGIFLDSGCARTLVRRQLVPESAIQNDVVEIRCVHGDATQYPVAELEIEVDGRKFVVRAGVADELPVPVLLGTDIPDLMVLIGETAVPDEVLVVTTRAQARSEEAEDRARRQKEEAACVRAKPVEEFHGDDDEDQPAFDFSEDMFTGGRSKVKPTRSQKRANNLTRAPAQPQHPLEVTAEHLVKSQEADPSLATIRQAAAGTPSSAGTGFYYQDGLLYRSWVPKRGDGLQVEQLVLPREFRESVLELAHAIPLAGHLGRNKTRLRILQRFYWPNIFKDAADYCKSCPSCQKTSKKMACRAPMIPLPIMEEPFQRIAMDIVGPLPRSRAGNRYVLVICDYATRYPEAVPLKSIDTEHVAEALVTFFSRVGIAREILTDQGSNFVSQLMTEVYRLLQVHPIKTSPYHPQTDGLVERFNQTLKAMLRKTAAEAKDWDKLLPYVLFAYREVPQASTGFSPFELLYGRPVRGPLDVLRETWEAKKTSNESVVSYVLTMREKLASMTELVQQNVGNAARKQKAWYDKNAREREFQVGERVLVLLPTATSKMLAQWHGPYPVVARHGKVNYEVDMGDTRKRRRTFHVNMLQKWHEPTVASLWVDDTTAEDGDEDEGEDIPTWDGRPTTDDGPTINPELTEAEKRQLDCLLEEFSDILRNEPGHTTLVEHGIHSGTARPVKLQPYRLPQVYREVVKEELRAMEESGIIEPSTSSWGAPVVLVKKKDGSMRFCVDYRRLNELSESDAYPMPRVDDLIDQLGGAKYLTTLDLTRGYWQVPVEQASKEKTAFVTPYGLFQFRMMPFGLNGAPATFQRLMDQVIRGAEDFTGAYLDDLVIFSRTWTEHLEHLHDIFTRLRQANLTAKPKKCQFGMARCTYLGHMVGGGEVRPEPSKVEAIRTFPVPTTKKQVRVFLGLSGYYRKFIPNYSSQAAVLTDLTRKNQPTKVEWSAECEGAFHKLRDALCQSPVLRSPDYEKQFILQTDASERGLGAVLSQCDENGDDHPVAFYSRKFLPREERYATVEKECLAIKIGVHAFRVHLLGRPFTIVTDHRSLEWLNRMKGDNARLTRWSLSLQPYQFDVRYRPGTSNGNADALSRGWPDTSTTASLQEKGEAV